MVFARQVQRAVLPFWRDGERLVYKRMLLDDAGGVFRHLFQKGLQLEGVFRIVGVLVTVSPESRSEKDDFLFPQKRVFFVKFLPFLPLVLPVEQNVCPRYAEGFHLVGRDGKCFGINAADGLAADADKVIVSVVHGALRGAARLAHACKAEGLEGAAGMPELHHFCLPADVQPVKLRVEVLQNDHPGFRAFLRALAQLFLFEGVHRAGVDKFCDFHFRVVLKPAADPLEVAPLFRQTLGQKEDLRAAQCFITGYELLVFCREIIGVTLSRAVIVAAQPVDSVVCPFYGRADIFVFFEPGADQQYRQPDGTAAEGQYISSSDLLRSGKQFPLYRKRLVIKDPLPDAAPERKGDGHLMPRRLPENVWQLDLRVCQYLCARLAFLDAHFHRETPVHLALGKNRLYPYFFILHLVRQLAAKAQPHDTAADIDSYSVIKLFHLFLPIVRSRRAA